MNSTGSLSGSSEISFNEHAPPVHFPASMMERFFYPNVIRKDRSNVEFDILTKWISLRYSNVIAFFIGMLFVRNVQAWNDPIFNNIRRLLLSVSSYICVPFVDSSCIFACS